MPNCAAKTPPSRNIPIQARGEASISRRIGSGLVVLNTGAGLTESRIGAKAIDTSTEGMMKRMKPDTSPSVTRYCAVTMPAICTIM